MLQRKPKMRRKSPQRRFEKRKMITTTMMKMTKKKRNKKTPLKVRKKTLKWQKPTIQTTKQL